MARISFSRTWWLGLGGVLGAWAVHAAAISQLTPQGASPAVHQLVVQTSADAVALGNPQATAPVLLHCAPEAAAAGSGRWNGAREWVWQFAQSVPAGTRCEVTPNPAFQLPAGGKLQTATHYQFFVPGPAVLNTWPSSYESIDESQTLVLQLNGQATPESLEAHVFCQAQDVGERIPVQLLDAVQTAQLLQALEIDASSGHYVALRCQRRLTAGTQMQLVYGAGVAMPNGVRHGSDTVLDFQVREAFTAQMQCQRERAQAGCLPIRDVQLSFSAPVPLEQAQQVYLQRGLKKHRPLLDADTGDTVRELRFAAPFTPLGDYQLVLPTGLQDDAQRSLSNAASFPLTVRMGDTPPLLKFAAAPFGVLERFAEGKQGVAVLPVTVRSPPASDGTPAAQETDAPLRSLRLEHDADIIRWWDKVQRYDRGWVSREQALTDSRAALPPRLDEDSHALEARSVSLLRNQSGVQLQHLPQVALGETRQLEVLGLPLPTPGFYVLEAESPRLGAALLDERLGTPRSMYVRTSALVTNLAVHLKLGREGSAVWVTSLDLGLPVAQAQVQVSDCRGRVHASGRTGSDGVWLLPELEKQAPRCQGHEGSGQWFVSARHTEEGVPDMAFVWSDWQRGMEPWRFNLPVGWGSAPDLVAHSVLDRNLVRAGEMVSMKHFVRAQTLQGLALPDAWPVEMQITHVGSNQQYKQPLQWRDSHNGGRTASSSFAVPAAAKLGLYTVELRWPESREHGQRVMQSGSFRVEAFRLPVFQGSVQPVDQGPLIAPQALDVAVQLSFLNGGAASGQSVQLSALLQPHEVGWERWNGYSFRTPREAEQVDREGAAAENYGSQRLIANKLPLTLDAQGQGQQTVRDVPALAAPQQLLLEASFADPNGEIQTLRSTHMLWPAAVVAGLRTEGWMSVDRKMRLQALALDTQGQPQAGVPLQVYARHHRTTSTRKRLVGGFYSYDNQRSSQDLGEVCRGSSDARGLLLCEVQVAQAGEVELVVTAQDREGRKSRAADTVWVTGQGELWFGGQDHDRMDVLAEKSSYVPGEVAKLQVRMPFREATALVSVEREGVLHTEVVQLQGQDPTISLPVQAGWGPNVYVSVLALRGRLYEVPWYSFFTWGYKAPRQWWSAYREGSSAYVPPTGMVDLSKPAFRFGVAELQVQDRQQQLHVALQADQHRYQVRETAKVTIRARLPDGQPAAHAEAAVAAVDQALLELSPNTSWQLREAMWQRRDWSVETATAQMEVVGRRHYGRKAAPPGGGGGSGAPTRELLNTLLLWQPRVQLDAQGQAEVLVPLNDALTRFTIVAVVDDGVQRFGTGSVQIATTQDLQIISGLPPVVREGDQFQAQLTLRNTTAEPMQIALQASVPGLQLPAQTVELAAQSAQTLVWEVRVPNLLQQAAQAPWPWHLQATDTLTGAQDSLMVPLRVQTAVPVAVQQAALVQLDGRWEQVFQWPSEALPAQGGVRLALSARLADPVQGVPGLRSWWAAYPYVCLEQTLGKAIGLGDEALWQRTTEQLPAYLDDDGLAMYFPPQSGRRAQGSDALTAYLLEVDHSLQQVDPRFQLPDAQRARMEAGLIAFVEGRIARNFWSPRADLEVRKLAAIAALAAHGKARPAMLESLRITPHDWPTHAVLDWMRILQRMPALPEQPQRLAQVQQELRTRLAYNGSVVGFRSEAQDHWWWLMQDTDVNVARLLLSTMDEPAWAHERTRLVTGLLARQKQGSWQTTVANTWAALALRHFSQRYERDAVTGSTTAALDGQVQTVDWGMNVEAGVAAEHGQTPGAQPWQADTLPTWFFARGPSERAALHVEQQGSGKPWLAVQSLAAVPRTSPVQAGYAVQKTVTPIQGAGGPPWQRGDVVRVRIAVHASADMSWVVLQDPVPAGATILGSGLGRDSAIALQSEGQDSSGTWPVFVERAQDSYRAYWDYLPAGQTVVEYTMRLSNAGDFTLPSTRIEALYAPEVMGELPNPRWQVQAP